jgi:hypothetical protein
VAHPLGAVVERLCDEVVLLLAEGIEALDLRLHLLHEMITERWLAASEKWRRKNTKKKETRKQNRRINANPT